jgi:dynein heavy chain
MKGSPFAKVYLDRIIEWEAWLLLSFKIIDMWLKVQQNWLYLEPVFASADIKKQLPNEATLFKEVDNQWRRIME